MASNRVVASTLEPQITPISWDNSHANKNGPDVTGALTPQSGPNPYEGRASMQSTRTDPTSVYRYYDVNSLLLYVGITDRGITRNIEHNTSKDWWPFVHRQEVDHFPARDLAINAERSLIETYRPPFNVQHNPSHRADRAAYLAFAAGGATHPPRVDFTVLLKRLGRSIDLRRTAVIGDCAVFVSGLEYADVVSKINTAPARVPVDGAGGGGRVRLVEVSGGALKLHIAGVRSVSASSARARLGYVTTKPVMLRVTSVRIDPQGVSR